VAVRIVLLGGPGAGKGTQAKRLCEAHELAHIASGDILREHVANDTALGRKIDEALDQGHLVSDELACAVVFERLCRPDSAAGYVLDGFPRSVPQAESLGEWLERRDEQLDGVVLLDVSDEEIVDRIVARRQCPDCGAIYNLRLDNLEEGARCPRTGCDGTLVRRGDDNEETIRERLRVYHETTQPIIAYYEQLGLLKRVPGDGMSPDDVYLKIEDVLAAMGVVTPE
jgi:adenylate kinase